MEPLQLKSESQVYMYLKTFIASKTKAIQLDGSKTPKKNGKVIIIFRYSVDGQKYKLLGDLTLKAIQHFIALTDEQGSPALALREYNKDGRSGLILADSKSPNGWHCTKFEEKNSDLLKRSA